LKIRVSAVRFRPQPPLIKPTNVGFFYAWSCFTSSPCIKK